MATAVATAAPLHEDFAALLDESFGNGNLQEGSVIKGTVVGIEKDVAVIDVGLKTEGRVPLREFSGPGRSNELKVGDTVEVKEASKQLTHVLEATQLPERDVPDYLEVDHSKMTAKFNRIPHLSDVPFAVQMEPHLIVEFYSR